MVHGFVERMLNLFESNIEVLEASGTAMLNAATIPVPLAYVQMARLLLISFLFVFPFQLNPDEGVYTNIRVGEIITSYFSLAL